MLAALRLRLTRDLVCLGPAPKRLYRKAARLCSELAAVWERWRECELVVELLSLDWLGAIGLQP